MARKFIQNCTGNLPKESKISQVGDLFSHFIFRLLVVCFIGVLGYVLFFSEYLKITKIGISGLNELKAEDLQSELESQMEGKFLNLLPKNNFLFFSKNRTENILEDKFKKIRTAEAEKKFPDEISIQIDERKALLVWCAGEDCFLMDENGVAYSNADFNSPELSQNNLIKIEDASRRSVAIGENVINSKYEQYALAVKDALKDKKFEANGYFTPSRVADELDVRTQQGVEIYLSTQFPLESAMHTLDVVLDKEISKEQREKLAYIDLRSENKVFYKFKEEEQKENLESQDEEVD